MKYNSVLDVQLSGGASFIGDPAQLLPGKVVATQGQSLFTIPALVDSTVYLVFVDGIQFYQADALADGKDYTFNDATGEIEILNGQDAGVIISYLYATSGASIISTPEPVTLVQAKEWCRIDGNDEDDLILDLISAARAMCESFTNISFISRTVVAYLRNELGGQYLPYGPVGAIDYLHDDDGEEVSTDDYKVKGKRFKQLLTCFEEPVTISYTAGYEVLPPDLKNGLLQQIDYMYNNRGSDSTTVAEPVKAILKRYRRVD